MNTVLEGFNFYPCTRKTTSAELFFLKAKNSLECLPLTSSLALGDGDIYGIGCNNYVE